MKNIKSFLFILILSLIFTLIFSCKAEKNNNHGKDAEERIDDVGEEVEEVNKGVKEGMEEIEEKIDSVADTKSDIIFNK